MAATLSNLLKHATGAPIKMMQLHAQLKAAGVPVTDELAWSDYWAGAALFTLVSVSNVLRMSCHMRTRA